MSKRLVFLVLLSLTFCIARSQTTLSLKGKVIDAVNGKPLANCSIYLNNTSVGTVTKEDGAFTLRGIPHGRSDLVISAIGYSTYLLHIRGDSLPEQLKVQLRQAAAELSSFTVESYLKDGWRQYGKFFLDNFIGTADNASRCTLINKKVLRFHYLKKSRRLTVSATAPLIIRNKSLGYDLQYQLEHFAYDENTHIIFYQGYPLFREMSTTEEDVRKRWIEKRKKAYLGSMHHFIQSLYKEQLPEQGFLLEHYITTCNEEKLRVLQVYDPNAPVGTYSKDSLYYYWRVMRQPDSNTEVARVPPDQLVATLPEGQKTFAFRGKLFIKYFYQLNPPPPDYWESYLTLMNDPAVEIEENGSYFPAEDMLADGYWAQTEKICNLLPLDYPMPANPPVKAR